MQLTWWIALGLPTMIPPTVSQQRQAIEYVYSIVQFEPSTPHQIFRHDRNNDHFIDAVDLADLIASWSDTENASQELANLLANWHTAWAITDIYHPDDPKLYVIPPAFEPHFELAPAGQVAISFAVGFICEHDVAYKDSTYTYNARLLRHTIYQAR